ncbi:hypothetical protein MKW94_030363 [Papaver nudicaule]|uniref:Pentatricopeptide repeat-containing protein n=1 Tax=Papaver nudicaule TaxID=74823 RepID=A0AA41VGA3_PAPNU|nr:hypothetical protein [Papaver nudicaule]
MPIRFSANQVLKRNLNPQNSPKNHPSCVVQRLIDIASQGKFKFNLKQAAESIDFISRKGIRLDSQTVAFLLKHCAKSRSLTEGKWVHLHLSNGRKRLTALLSNYLIHMYSSCGDYKTARKVFDKMYIRNLYSWNNMLSGYAKLGLLEPAERLFDQMPERDVVSWNTMVISFAKNGFHGKALSYFAHLRRSSIAFDHFSFAGVLISCVKLENVGLTQQVHAQILVAGLLSNVVLSNSTVDAYVKCGLIKDARKLFNGMAEKDVFAWTTMVSGYAKSGDLKSAWELFSKMPELNTMSWTLLIEAYVRKGQGHEALRLFEEMTLRGFQPDQFTFSSSLCACASIASLRYGKQIHARLIKMDFVPNTIVVSSLIDMYSKCGCLDIGRRVFYLTRNKQDAALWNTMISSLAQHGIGEEAIDLFLDMMKAGVKPDKTTLVFLLNACSHSGLVDVGIGIFEIMTMDYDIVADQDHYAWLIDLLGRAGRLDEVELQLEKMPCKPDTRVWNSVLSACMIHRNVELGRKAVKHLLKLEPQESAADMLLANLYASVDTLESLEKVWELLNKRRVKKERAVSWVEIENTVHTFTVSDRSHPLEDEICLVLQHLTGQIEDELFGR